LFFGANKIPWAISLHPIPSHPIALHCMFVPLPIYCSASYFGSICLAWTKPNRTQPAWLVWYLVAPQSITEDERFHACLYACSFVCQKAGPPANLALRHHKISSNKKLCPTMVSHRIVLKRIWHTHICSFLLFGSNPQASKHGKKQPRGSVCRRRRHRSFCFKNGGNQPKRKK